MWESEKQSKQSATIIDLYRVFCEQRADEDIKKLKPDSDEDKLKKALVDYYFQTTKNKNDNKDYQVFLETKKKKIKNRKTIDIKRDDQLDYLYTTDIEVVIIDSVEKAIKEFNHQNMGKDDKEYFFRGHEDYNYKCAPSLLRVQNYYDYENELYSELQTLSPRSFLHKNKHLEILTEMQHFSLPTRLLDISSNPLSALFFATSYTDINSQYKNGEILVFETEKTKVKYFSSDVVEIQTSLAYLPKETKKEIWDSASKLLHKNMGKKQRVEEFNEEEAVKKLMHEASKSGIIYTNSLDPEDLFNLFICLPLKNNDRISSQNGAFFSYGFLNRGHFCSNNSDELDEYEKKIKFFLYKVGNPKKKEYNRPQIRKRFIIPYACKTKINNQLERLGIHQGNIYPDIEKRSAYIKEKYLRR